MPADYIIKAGDTLPAYNDTLTYSDGSGVQLVGATVQWVMRSPTQALPVTITGTVTTNPLTGQVVYTPTSADTAQPGNYMANWLVTFSGGGQMTFPTDGWISVNVQENLLNASQQLVSLPALKDHIGLGHNDRSHDAKLLRYVRAITPVIEGLVGPVLVRTFEEWHDGGQYYVQLRRRPSTALGSNPVITLLGADEYRGPIKYTLTEIPDPSAASIYSVMLDRQTATLYRRTTGGGVIPFGAGPWGGGMPSAVHVAYQAGQSPIPANISEAALEAIRIDYETTMSTGQGSRAMADTFDQTTGGPNRQVMSRVVRELLGPMRRRPGIA